MPKRIYVGNLPFSATDDEVRALCRRYGKVLSVRIDTVGRERSAFVEMEADEENLAGLRKATLGGQRLTVRET